MAAELVDTKQTKYTLNQLVVGLIDGWNKQFGEYPKKESVGVIYAQNALETGGTVSMWNNNLGNVKFVPSANPSDDDGKQYMMLNNVWEMINGQKVIFQPPSQATWFRAFPTLGDGVAYHLDFLKNHRYKNAWTAIESGNPAAFAHLLKVSGYYTASESDYSRLMCYYFNKYMKETVYEDGLASLMPVTNTVPEEPAPPSATNEDKSSAPESQYTKIINVISSFPWSNIFKK